MHKYFFLLLSFTLIGCASNDFAEKSWCKSFNDALAQNFKNETTLGAQSLDTIIGCAPRPLPKFVDGSTVNNSVLLSKSQKELFQEFSNNFPTGSQPTLDNIKKFTISKEAKQLALIRVLMLNEFVYAIAEQTQKNKTVAVKTANFETLNTLSSDNIKKIKAAIEVEIYAIYQRQVFDIQRGYYDILYQITLGGADKDGIGSIKYDYREILPLLEKVVLIYADQQKLKSTFLLIRDEYFAQTDTIPRKFDDYWNKQLENIKSQCKISATSLGLSSTIKEECKSLGETSQSSVPGGPDPEV